MWFITTSILTPDRLHHLFSISVDDFIRYKLISLYPRATLQYYVPGNRRQDLRVVGFNDGFNFLNRSRIESKHHVTYARINKINQNGLILRCIRAFLSLFLYMDWFGYSISQHFTDRTLSRIVLPIGRRTSFFLHFFVLFFFTYTFLFSLFFCFLY